MTQPDSSFLENVLSTDLSGHVTTKVSTTTATKKTQSKGKKRRKMKKKNRNKPKKAMTPFMVFSKETRKHLVAENPSLTFSEIGKELGARWRSLTDKDKEIFVLKAREDYQRFLDETERMEAMNPTRKRKTVEQKRQTKMKKSISAYLYFCNAHREQVKAIHPDMKMVEIQRLLAEKWMKSPASVKLPFEKQAEADREKFKEENISILPPSFKLKYTAPTVTPDYTEYDIKQENRIYSNFSSRTSSAFDSLRPLVQLPNQENFENERGEVRVKRSGSVFSHDNLDIS